MDLTDQEQDSRRAILKEWVAAMGGHAAVVRHRRLSPAQASYLSQVINGYSFGPRAARNMEKRLGLPPRSLEPQSAGDHPRLTPAFPRGALVATDAIEVLLALADRINAARWASVRAQLDLVIQHPEMKPDIEVELRRLLGPDAGNRTGTDD